MLALIVNTWYTIILNGVAPYTDTATLVKIAAFGEGRWGELVKAPCFCLNGSVANYATRTVVTDAYKLDRTNVLIPVVGSNNIPFVIAARAAERIAVTANETPATGYKGLLDGINPGADSEQETNAVLDAGMKKGSSNTVLYNGVVQLNDIVTFYHPTGQTDPAYRYVVTIVKLQNILNGLRTVLENPDITALPLLPDSAEVVSQQDFMRPRDFVTMLSNLADDQFTSKLLLAEAAYTQNALKTNVTINSTNPNRVDIKYPVKISGNVEIISADLNFSFYYGV
jgi:phage tail sheath gpL-like